MAGSGIAEDAERQWMVLGENALGPERRGNRYGETLGKAPQTVGGAAMLDAGAGEDRNAFHRRCAILAEERAASARRHRSIDRMRVEQCLIDRLMSDMKLARQPHHGGATGE